MRSSIIVVDVGNTSVKLALACEDRLSGRLMLPSRALSTQAARRALARLARGREIEGAILCSVVPAVNAMWLRELKAAIGRAPMLLHHEMNLGFRIALPEPEKIGADRLANVCAVSHLHGTPAIVVDFGTAVTFDVVSKKKEYIGGVIAPGLPFMSDYFAERTALLPRLSWTHGGGSIRRPSARRRLAFGANTEEAMLVGIEAGYLGMVREILARIRGGLRSPISRLVATGGYAEWVLAGSDIKIEIDPDLTLRGISRIYELNR